MKFYRIIAVIFIQITLVWSAAGQIEKPGTPWTKLNRSPLNKALTINIPQAPSAWNDLVADQDGPGLKPDVFAWPVDTMIDIFEARNRIFRSNQLEVYQIHIASPSAYSLNVIFASYYLPEGAELYLYNRDYSVVRGAYTSLNNKDYRQLATSPVPGNEIFIELVLNLEQNECKPELVVGRVSADMVNAFGNKSGQFGRSGDCNVDINCPPGSDWQVVKRSVAKFIRGGTYLCSGALINNTANDGKPYFLTANHCITTGLHARLSVFYFNYESPECRGGDGNIDQSISGSDLLATSSHLDFALVELQELPPESYKPYYSGWDRSVVQYWDTVTCIHHPSGDVKKISKANRRVATGDFGTGGFDSNVFWHVSQWDLGTTEGGSSGSPLFNQEQRIIGDLTGGDASCTYNYNDYYQKFSLSWDKYTDSTEQLKHWLDPLELGPNAWNGYDPYQNGKPLANFSHRPDKPKTEKYVRFIDNSTGSPDTWEWTFEDGVPASTGERNPLAYFTHPGLKTIQLVVSNEEGTDTLRQTLEVLPNVDFSASQHRLVVGSTTRLQNHSSAVLTEINWEINEGIQTWFDQGQEINQEFLQAGQHHVKLQTLYDGANYAFFHQNCFQVVADEIIFSGQTESVSGARESAGAYALGEYGLIPGTNSLGYDAFANRFTSDLDTTKMITGIRIDVEELSDRVNPVELTLYVWDDDWNELAQKSIQLNAKTLPFRATAWLDNPVGMDSAQYAGFVVPDNEELVFASGMTLTRDDADPNNAWGRLDGNWNPLSQAFGLNSAISVQLETTSVFPSFKEQIKAWYNSNTRLLHIDLQGLVFSKLDINLYDAAGRKVNTLSNIYQDVVQISMPQASSGIYFINVVIDSVDFTTKVLVVN